MRITESQLRKIIKTELRKVLAENVNDGVRFQEREPTSTQSGIILNGEELSVAKVISIFKQADDSTTETKLSDVLGDYSDVTTFKDLQDLADMGNWATEDLAHTVAQIKGVPYLDAPKEQPKQAANPSHPLKKYGYKQGFDYGADSDAALRAMAKL